MDAALAVLEIELSTSVNLDESKLLPSHIEFLLKLWLCFGVWFY